MTDNAPRTLWVVVDKDGVWRTQFRKEEDAKKLSDFCDTEHPDTAPHRVVAYVPQGASVQREPTVGMIEAGMDALVETPTTICADDLCAAYYAMYDAAPREPVKAHTRACESWTTPRPGQGWRGCICDIAQEDKP